MSLADNIRAALQEKKNKDDLATERAAIVAEKVESIKKVVANHIHSLHEDGLETNVMSVHSLANSKGPIRVYPIEIEGIKINLNTTPFEDAIDRDPQINVEKLIADAINNEVRKHLGLPI